MSSARRLYDRYWADSGQAPPAHDPLRDQRLRIFLPLVSPGTRLLDVGCGAGRETLALAARADGIVGLDISPLALAAAQQAGPPGRWVCGSLDAGLPFASGSFTAVYCCEVIEHVLDVEGALSELNRVLARGGRLFLSTPYHGWLKNLAIAMVAFDRHFDPTGPHIRFFTRRSLSRALQAAGFRVEGMRGLGRFWPLWMNLAVWARKR